MLGDKVKVKKAKSGDIKRGHMKVNRFLSKELIDDDEHELEYENTNPRHYKSGSNREILADKNAANKFSENEDSYSGNEFVPQGDLSIKQLALITSISAFVALFLLDYLLYDKSLINSASYILPLQNSLTGLAFSYIGYYLPIVGIAVFIHLYVFFNMHSLHSTFVVFQLAAPLTVIILLKGIYYRGRPFLVAADVQGCNCDPGMPSGHSGLSLTVAVIIYRTADFHYFRFMGRPAVYRGIAISLLTLLVVLASLSRLVLGSHDLWQLFVGLVIAAVVTVLVNFANYKYMIRSAGARIKVVAALFIVVWIVLTYGLHFINTGLRDGNPSWKYWDKCNGRECFRSFSGGQTKIMLSYLFFPFYFIFYRFKTERGIDEGDEHNLYTDATPGVGYKRSILAQYIFYLAAHVPIVLVYLPYWLLPCGTLACYVTVAGFYWPINTCYLAFLLSRLPNQKPANIALSKKRRHLRYAELT